MSVKAKAVRAATAQPMFTNWGRDMDGPRLDLWIERDGRIADRVTIDIRDLSKYQGVLTRMPPKLKARMLWEAREVSKGNFSLDPEFPGYESAGGAT